MNNFQDSGEQSASRKSDASASAADALRQDALNGAPVDGRSASAAGASPAASSDLPGGAGAGQTGDLVEQRRAEERQRFTELFRQQNFALEMKEGWGPFQALQKMVQDNKLSMTDEQMSQEANRIRNRDFKDWQRAFYKMSDRTMLWSDSEIEKKVQETVNRVKGIDVSSHQKDIDWKQVKQAGYQFAFLKASEGIDWVDPNFATYRAGAREAGLAVGYYHFFRPNDAVDLQVKNFVSTVGKAEPDSLRLVVDVEDPSIWKPYTVQQRVKMIDDWCTGVKKELGVTPQIAVYGSPSFFGKMLENSPQLSKYSLWVANYNVPEPILPAPWTRWDFWQYSDRGKVPGIQGNVDLDMYYRSDLNEAEKIKSRHRR